MNLTKKLQIDMKQALKEKDKEKLATLRLVITDLKNEQIKLQKDLSEEDEVVVLKRYVKKLNKEIETYKELNLSTEKQEKEKVLLEEYLPQSLSEEKLTELIDQYISEHGSNLGQVMKYVKTIPGADMKLASSIIKAKNNS